MDSTVKFIRGGEEMKIRNQKPPKASLAENGLEIRSRKLALLFLLTVALLNSGSSLAQSGERKLIRDGNKLYKEKKFSDAEVEYKKSLGLNQNSIPGNYNLGNAYYKQGKFDEASQQYQSILSNKDINDEQKAKAFHNIGNSLLESKKFEESINAYKNALKMNPKDNDTRYNLAYAQSMLQQQQQQKQQQQNDKNDQKKNQENKDQQKKEQQNKQQEKQENAEEKQAKEKKNISKEDAEKILQALNNDEKNTQKKLIKKDGTRIQIEKNW
jgi:Ca-activated chloride channel family protein